MVAFKAEVSKVDHLELAAKYLNAHADNPAVAVYRYIKSILPQADDSFAVEMSGFLIGSIGSMLLKSYPDTELLQAKRLASMIVMSILPAGADLGMTSKDGEDGGWRTEDGGKTVPSSAFPQSSALSPQSFEAWFDDKGFATVLMSEHQSGQAPSSLILLPIEAEAQRRYEGHIRDVDLEHDPHPGAWIYRRIMVRLAS
jgi:hypothetical protein